MPRRNRVDLLAVALLSLTTISLCGQACAEEATRLRDVVYGHKSGLALVMDIVEPAKPNGIGILVLVSSGFNSDVNMIENGSFQPEKFKTLTDRGDTLFLVCHGSQPKFMVSDIISDIHRAVRFVRAHGADYGVDPNRLGITGASSGGYLSLMIGTTGKPGNPTANDPIDRVSSQVQAVACFFPPADLLDYGKPGRSFLEYEPVKFVWPIFGAADKPKEERIKALQEISPFAAVSKETAPTFIIHGDNDLLVPHEQSERFAAKLQECQVPHQLEIRKGAGHGWPNMDQDFVLFADWFDKQLAPKNNKQ